MACQAMHMWSLSGLVAAFVDLSIAYLLLCGSSIAFLASKFLGFFGLNLPCPCDGLFLNIPSKEYCLSRLLVDFPTQKVSSVHLSVKHKFPFNDSVWGTIHNYGVLENDHVNRIPQIEGEGSCSSVSDVKMSRSVVLKELSERDEKCDLNGKRVSDHRPRSRLRQRRKGGGGRGKYSSVSSYDSSVNGGWEPYSHSHQLEYNEKASTVMGVSQRSLSSVEINLYPNEDMHMTHATSVEELQDQHGVQNFNEDEKNTIKLLEKELEEERMARAALYIELEKERSAAASAADEAMAMILRLQEEKAAIEMEARQSQRIIDEKSAYDAEEMNILKEILVRREMEKHFLEKEVEAYRQMVSLGNEQLGGHDSDNNDAGRLFDLMLDPDDDPIVMLHQLNASNEKKVITETSCSDGVGKLQEKEMISADNNSYLTPNVPEECEFLENTTPMEKKEVEQIEKTNGDHELSEKIIVACNGTETSSNYGLNLEQETSSNNSCDGMFDKDSHVHDVHVIGDQTDLYRSSSDITRGLPPMGPKGKSLLSDLRRSSMSAVDSEMLKIDCEVGKLRERLKFVQEGREKLSFSVESRERESMQLKLLEDISRQVQEIRDLTEPGRAARQASLPLPNSKVLSKRRRCRSVSSGPQWNSRGSNTG